MSNANKNLDELQQIMADALFQMQRLTDDNLTKHDNFVPMVKLFLIGVISTAADLVEVTSPGLSSYLYAEIEAAAKQSGLRAIRDSQGKGGASYSISEIGSDDETLAMNYIGQELGTTLFKAIHELPMPLRKPEMFLRGIEGLLANLLDKKFAEHNPHQVLDNLSEHVHMILDDLQSRHKRSVH